MNRKGEMGVGTLIIFIALLLVAAVAAGVLIQTAGSLQQKALSTGTEATGQISTSAIALEVSATDGSDQTVENFTLIMKLAPGSEPMKLGDVTMTFSTTNDTQTLDYSNASQWGTTTTFGVDYLQEGTNSQVGRLSRGDVIAVNFASASSIEESAQLRINFIPKIGVSTNLLFSTPDVINTDRVYLYP